MFEFLPQLLASGLSVGMLYALIGLALTLSYRATTVVNFGHGDVVMAGAFTIFLLYNAGLPISVAIPLGCAILFAFGVSVQMTLMRPIMDGPHLSVSMMALATGFVLRGIARLQSGAVPLQLPRPYPMASFDVFGVSITSDDLFVAGAVLVLLVGLTLLMRTKRVGKIIQAIFQTRRGAELVGINVPLVQGVLWGSASALAAASGALLGLTMLVTPDMGSWTLIRGFAAMAIGGFGSLGGAIVGGLLLGALEKLLGFYASSVFIEITAYVVTIVVLLIRPQGLFGKPPSQRV